jgi:hypothetical protein
MRIHQPQVATHYTHITCGALLAQGGAPFLYGPYWHKVEHLSCGGPSDTKWSTIPVEALLAQGGAPFVWGHKVEHLSCGDPTDIIHGEE